MRAVENLLRRFEHCMHFVHARRREAVCRAVKGLLAGGRLWLTGLGRDLPGETSDKHRIKAVDRLLGNATLQRELLPMYRARARLLLGKGHRPVLVVDWTGVTTPFFILSAGLCCSGRTLPLYSEVHPKSVMATRAVHRAFLKRLKAVLPADCRPIIVTDAGFYSEWLDDVRKQGWDFVGRLRGRLNVRLSGAWVFIKTLYTRATKRPKNIGVVAVRKKGQREFRLVLSAAPKLKGRHRLTQKGTIGQRTNDHRYRAQKTEPWLLATSLSSNSKFIVRLYAQRMQIEETFRDTKNPRYGWALRDCRSRCAKRLEVLLFICALAFALVATIGRAAEKKNLHHRFQANTVRSRRVLSWFFLGVLVLRRTDSEFSDQCLSRALRCLQDLSSYHGREG